MSLAKKVIGGTSIISFASTCARLLGFLSLPVLSNLLGSEPYGEMALATAGISLGTALALVGIDMAYARFYLQESSVHSKDVESYCWIFAVRGAIFLALIIAIFWLYFGTRWVDDPISISVYSSIAILFSVLAVMSTTRARLLGRYNKIAYTIFLSACLSISLSLALAIFWHQDVRALLAGAVCGPIITLLLLGSPKLGAIYSKTKLPRSEKREIVFLGLAGSITAPMYWIISSSDKWILAEFSDTNVVGIYSVASSIALIGLVINSSLTLTWFPEAARVYSEQITVAKATLGGMWEKLVCGLAMAWLTVAATGSEVLVLITPPEFHSGTVFIPYLAGGVFFYGVAGMATTAFFLQKKMGIVAIIWVLGSVINLTLNFILIPKYFALGAAIAQLISFFIISAGLLIISGFIYPLKLNPKALSMCLLIATLFGMALHTIWSESILVSLILKTPVLFIAYISITYLIAPDWLFIARDKLIYVIRKIFQPS